MEKFSDADLNVAVARLGMLVRFPSDEGSKGAIMAELAKLCPHRKALLWLIDQMVLLTEWPGPGEMRGLLCTKYAPSDGRDAACHLPGRSSADFEDRAIAESEQWKDGAYPELPEDSRKFLEAAKPRRLM